MTSDNTWFKRAIWWIIGISLLVHVAALVLGHTVLEGWHWAHLPTHAAAEMSGSVIALLVAYFLVSLDRRSHGGSFNIIIAGALVGMGVLDGLHALVHAGQSFVWLHSTATLMGGLLFMLVWLPENWRARFGPRWPLWVFILVLLFGVAAMLEPAWTAKMVVDGRFSPIAVALNVGGGLLLFVAALRLYLTHRRTNNIDDLLFCLHCFLFGAAAVMFEQSTLWDLAWWTWHLLRLLAYLVALWFIILSDQRAQAELDRVNADLRQRTAALENSNRDLTSFAYVASHDLQEPLRKIQSFGGILREDIEDAVDEDAMESLNTITSAANRMSELVDALLLFSRVTHQSPSERVIDLNDVIGTAVGDLELMIEQAGGKVEIAPLGKVVGDPVQLRQLFENLISNGLKYAREGVAPVVKITAQHENDPASPHVRVSIRDNGIGFEHAYAEKIFEPFQRLHGRSSKFSGSGIGLAICRRIAERHGGSMAAKGEPEEGAEFIVTLPTQTGDPETKPEA